MWRSVLGSYFSCYSSLTIASEPCCSKDVGNLTSITVKLTILCNILEVLLKSRVIFPELTSGPTRLFPLVKTFKETNPSLGQMRKHFINNLTK